MTEPTTAAGRRFYYGNAVKGFEHKLLADILAIETEMYDLASNEGYHSGIADCKEHDPAHAEARQQDGSGPILPPSDFPQVDHPWAGSEDGHDCSTCMEAGDNFHKCDRMAHVTQDLRKVEAEANNRVAAENLRRYGGIAGPGFITPHREAEARQQDGSALRRVQERLDMREVSVGPVEAYTKRSVREVIQSEALAALPPSAPPALDVRGGCYFCGATGIASHAGCRGGNVPLPGDEDIERWYAAFAKVSGLDAKKLPGKRVIWERFAAEYARLQEQDR